AARDSCRYRFYAGRRAIGSMSRDDCSSSRFAHPLRAWVSGSCMPERVAFIGGVLTAAIR
ncbi:MAG TPA: hypothetical protein VIC55_01820, partial [Gemmatimonadaceae bacterium]